MRPITILLTAIAISFTAAAQDSGVLLIDEFDDMKNWKPLLFPKIPSHSKYSIERDGSNSVLKAATSASASGLQFRKSFNVKDYPRVKWRWKAESVYAKGDASSKAGDDYPLRIYIIFEYDPAKASFGLRTKYGIARKVYGEYPPHSSLNYIWANRKHQRDIIVSPYTGRSVMIPLQSGDTNTGKWITEEINVLDDYKKAFGEPPPEKASLAVMSDSDNTGESAVSYIDFIKVFR